MNGFSRLVYKRLQPEAFKPFKPYTMFSKRNSAEINAGSMADIAFLLLIFFLVTTTMDVDAGINRKLSPWEDEPKPSSALIHGKNIFTVLVNSQNKLLVEDELVDLRDLRQLAKDFINNNGDGSCDYCLASASLPNSSVNPHKAVISLQNDRATSYDMYMAVQNELAAAYNELRNELSMRRYEKEFDALNPQQMADIKAAYPQVISEAEPVEL